MHMINALIQQIHNGSPWGPDSVNTLQICHPGLVLRKGKSICQVFTQRNLLKLPKALP